VPIAALGGSLVACLELQLDVGHLREWTAGQRCRGRRLVPRRQSLTIAVGAQVLEAAWDACAKGPQPSLLIVDLDAALGLQPSVEQQQSAHLNAGLGKYGGMVGPNVGVGVPLGVGRRRGVTGALPGRHPLQWLKAHRNAADGSKGPRLVLWLKDEYVVSWTKQTRIFAN
jgi:hypothetical protein